jgi:hypothetical protein
MLEATGKRISEVSARWMEADAETLWAEIRELARNYDYRFAARILEVGEHEHWTVMQVALPSPTRTWCSPTTGSRVEPRLARSNSVRAMPKPYFRIVSQLK